MSGDAVADHMELVRVLSRRGGPLSALGATATVANPAWFDQDGATAARRDLHAALLAQTLAPPAAASSQGSAQAPPAAQAPSALAPDELSWPRAGELGQGRRAVVMAGPPGAGKSTVRTQLLGSHAPGWVVIDADAFKDGLIDAALADGSYQGWIEPALVKELQAGGEQFFPLEMSALLQAESGQLARLQRQSAMAQGRDIIIDTVLWNRTDALALGQVLAASQYEVAVVDVEVPYALSSARIAARWESVYRAALEGRAPRGGRWVPSEYARIVYGGPGGISGPSLSESSAQALAQECAAVVEYRLYRAVPRPGAGRQEVLATPAVLGEHQRRTQPGAVLAPVVADAVARGTAPSVGSGPRGAAPELDEAQRSASGAAAGRAGVDPQHPWGSAGEAASERGMHGGAEGTAGGVEGCEVERVRRLRGRRETGPGARSPGTRDGR